MQDHPLTCKAQNRLKLLIYFDREGINVLQFLSMEFGQPFLLVILSSRGIYMYKKRKLTILAIFD